MRLRRYASSLIAAVVLIVCTISSAAPRNPLAPETQPAAADAKLPEGFEAVPMPEGRTGCVLLAAPRKAKSAQEVMDDVMKKLAGHFDAAPQITKSDFDHQAGLARTLFRAKLKGEPMIGLAVAYQAGRSGEAAVMYDGEARIVAALDALAEVLWTAAPGFFDPAYMFMEPVDTGDAFVRLPRGWLVTGGGMGALEAAGPGGELASFGSGFVVVTPAGNRGPLGPLNHPLVAEYTDPVTAVKDVMPQLLKFIETTGAGPPARLVKVISHSPVEYPNGKAAFVTFEAERQERDKWVRLRSLSMVIMAPIGPQSWMFYVSSVAAPAERFDAMLPVLMNVWKSWMVNQKVHWLRWQQAHFAMTKCFEYQNWVIGYQGERCKNAMRKWQDYIRN